MQPTIATPRIYTQSCEIQARQSLQQSRRAEATISLQTQLSQITAQTFTRYCLDTAAKQLSEPISRLITQIRERGGCITNLPRPPDPPPRYAAKQRGRG